MDGLLVGGLGWAPPLCKQQGEVPSVITYGTLISACEQGKQPEVALELCEAMEQSHTVVPDVIT